MKDPNRLVGVEGYQDVFAESRAFQPGNQSIDTIEGHYCEYTIVNDQTKLPRCWPTASAAYEVQLLFGCSCRERVVVSGSLGEDYQRRMV